MAFTEEGLLGDFHGRLGNVVVYKLKGKTVMRTLPTQKRGPAKGKLKVSQGRFAQVMRAMKAVKPFIQTGFNDFSDGSYVFQRALSENLHCYLESGNPSDLRWLLLSKGERAGALDLSLEMGAGQATLRWGEPQPGKPAAKDDSVMLLALNTTTLESTEDTRAALRQDGQASLALPPVKAGEEILVFIAFMDLAGSLIRRDLKNISESQRVE